MLSFYLYESQLLFKPVAAVYAYTDPVGAEGLRGRSIIHMTYKWLNG